MIILPYYWLTSRTLLISAPRPENLICKFRVIRMAVKLSCPFMGLQGCQSRVENTPVSYTKLGICFNTQVVAWGWTDWQFELIVRLKSLFLYWGMNKYDSTKDNAAGVSKIPGIWIN